MFHMTDFASSKGKWKSWKPTSEAMSRRRAQFVAGLVQLVRRATRKGFVSTVSLRDYADANAIYTLSEVVGTPYFVGASACFGGLQAWAAKKGINYRDILCIMESGDDGQGDVISRLRLEGFNVIDQPKDNIRAFDACDLIAWKARTAIDDAFLGPKARNPDVGSIVRALDLIESAAQANRMAGFNVFAARLSGARRKATRIRRVMMKP